GRHGARPRPGRMGPAAVPAGAGFATSTAARRRRAEPARAQSPGAPRGHRAHSAPGRGRAPAGRVCPRNPGQPLRRSAAACGDVRLRGRAQGRRQPGGGAGTHAARDRRGQSRHGGGRHGRPAQRLHRRAARAAIGRVRGGLLRTAAARGCGRYRGTRRRARHAARRPARCDAAVVERRACALITLQLPDEAATGALAAKLAHAAPGSAVVYLHGDLGSGKSTLARAWVRTLGVLGTVRGPTYPLVERYPLATGGEALHLDLYRIGASGELEYLGLDDTAATLWLVEWPHRGTGALPPADLHLHLAISGSGRAARLEPGTAAGQTWLLRLAETGDLRPIPEPNP